MIARVASVTPALLSMLRSRNDDGTPELRVTRSDSALCYRCSECGHETADPYDDHACTPSARIHTVFAVVVARHDGAELSDTESAHVEATLAAHAVEPNRLAHKLRDPKFYTARTTRAVNSGGAL